jgi:hypothetical protein
MEEAVAVLTRTPAALDALVRGLPDGWNVANGGVGNRSGCRPDAGDR